jgi:hypothetical protein
MNAKNLMLGLFVVLTIVFASLATVEYVQMNSLSSQVQSAQSTTSSFTTCTATGGIGCPHFFNDTWTISVSYLGPWGITYQGYLGNGESELGLLVESGSFYGHGPANESVTVSGTTAVGTGICAEAQKLDASNSTLVVRILPPNVMNQTSIAYGTAKACLIHGIA